MAKICLRTVLHNKTEEKFFNSEVNAILDKNRIKYLDKDVTVILELEENTLNIIRRSNEYDILLPLKKGKKTIGNYHINGLGTLDLEVETTKLEIGDTTLDVHYKMIIDKESVSEFEFLLEYI